MSQHLGQHLRQEQKLTPRLIQSMTILQKPVADLEAYIEEALETNAALELADQSSQLEAEKPPPAADDHPLDDGFARVDRFSRDYDWEGLERAPRSHGDPDNDPKMAAMANTASRSASLSEYLLNQWSLLDLDEPLRRAGEAIIGRIDPDGYFRGDHVELAASLRPPVPPQTAELALKKVQRLDPPGIAARDSIECLKLQLDALPGDNTIERTLVEKHLDDVVHNRLPQIAKATGYSIGEITEAIRAMRTTLSLRPGRLVVEDSAPPVRPDVIVDYAQNGGGFEVRLTRGNLPNLRIREDVAALARATDSKETRAFAKKHVEEASALIDAVQFRRDRLLQVARSVAEHQRDFFDSGPSGLKALKMSDLATELECDPSTISRTVADKYLQTPQGIYPLRYFFTGGTESVDGESAGWDRLKTRVKELIDAENKGDPLSDDQIAAALAREKLDISRRTVAKYRQQLDIPAARQRKIFE